MLTVKCILNVMFKDSCVFVRQILELDNSLFVSVILRSTLSFLCTKLLTWIHERSSERQVHWTPVFSNASSLVRVDGTGGADSFQILSSLFLLFFVPTIQDCVHVNQLATRILIVCETLKNDQAFQA